MNKTIHTSNNEGKLSFVATPSGKLADITLRALTTFRDCVVVVC
ncbi:MAG: hypothetical protein ABIB04_02095 [Patescibacteria group bacterium]